MPRIDAPTVAEHNAMRRRQVIDSAVEVLADLGASGLTPAAVAKRAGLARSSLYQYYPSTEALLGAAVQGMLQRSVDRMVAAVGADGTPKERVTAYVRTAFADAAEGHDTLPDLSTIEMPEVCRVGVRALHDQLLDPLRSALADAGVADPRTSSVLVRGLVSSAARAVNHGAPAVATLELTVDFVLRGLGLTSG
jgi:AcrR family transcriptional regulator